MSLKFNINRPPVSDDEINTHKNFDQLIKQFKQQSLKKAQGDESWWKDKRIRYSTVIAGVTVICTITYLAVVHSKQHNQKKHETVITQKTNNSSTSKFIQAPSKSLALGYTSYKVNSSTGAQLTHSTSSKISIPKNSFVDKNGKELIGEVTIEYKEIHDLSDVIVSGIPMRYDSAGKSYQFESAGMFDIRGYQNGEPVFIKPGKEIDIALASLNNANRFNQYYLDTVQRNWTYLKKDSAFTQQGTYASKNSALNLSPLALGELKKEYSVSIPRKIDSVGKLYTNKTKQLEAPAAPTAPKKAVPGRPVFVIDASTDDFPELAAYENAVFEVGAENKNYSKEMHEVTWTDVKILPGPNKGKNYILNLIYRNRSEKLIVYPVLKGADFEKAQAVYEKQFENYQVLVKEKEKKEQFLLAEMQAKQAAYLNEQKKIKEEYDRQRALAAMRSDVREQQELNTNFNSMSARVKAERLFRISQFGIYNSDCPHASPTEQSVIPMFVLSEKGLPLRPELVYFVDHDTKTVTSCDQSSSFKLYYNEKRNYSICLFSKGKVFFCSKENFKSTVEANSATFSVHPLPASADNLTDFKKALEM